MEIFKDRMEAGRRLAEKLTRYADQPHVRILALPRGGVPVAYEIAKTLHLPLDVFIVRKLGVPGHEELAMGAITTGGTRVLNEEVIDQLQIPPQLIERVIHNEEKELQRRETSYRENRLPLQVQGQTIILVDDGLATGSTMLAAVRALRKMDPDRIVVAVPVAAEEICKILKEEVDEMICDLTPEPFHAVGLWYENFSQTSDEEVRDLLRKAA